MKGTSATTMPRIHTIVSVGAAQRAPIAPVRRCNPKSMNTRISTEAGSQRLMPMRARNTDTIERSAVLLRESHGAINQRDGTRYGATPNAPANPTAEDRPRDRLTNRQDDCWERPVGAAMLREGVILTLPSEVVARAYPIADCRDRVFRRTESGRLRPSPHGRSRAQVSAAPAQVLVPNSPIRHCDRQAAKLDEPMSLRGHRWRRGQAPCVGSRSRPKRALAPRLHARPPRGCRETRRVSRTQSHSPPWRRLPRN